MTQIKAAIRREYCGPHLISVEDIDKPTPKKNEVLIQVYATTVSRTDCAVLTAKPFIMRFVLGLLRPKKIILGTDFSGVIVSKGKNVKSFNVGDKVFGFVDIGSKSQAEFMTTTKENLFPIPPNITFKQAAASLEGAHYAYTFIHKANIQSGQRILINGATGAIGSALLQFVRKYDVKITATCDTKNITLIKSLGADKVYDYTREDFTTDPDKYDFVFDAVGKSTFGACKPLLKEKGCYISSELGPYWQNLFYALFAPMTKKKVIFPIPFNTQKTIPYISNLLEQGKFNPIIEHEYELDDVSIAYYYVLKGMKTGNVILNVKNS
jgi:NADPH:quinone reductase-like Zn-dependent oxidoreductase